MSGKIWSGIHPFLVYGNVRTQTFTHLGVWNGKSGSTTLLGRLTSSIWSCWNLSPISRSLRPICASTLTPACSAGPSATLSFSCPLPSSSSSSICLSPRSSMGSNWAGKCERNPALPERKNIKLCKTCVVVVVLSSKCQEAVFHAKIQENITDTKSVKTAWQQKNVLSRSAASLKHNHRDYY